MARVKNIKSQRREVKGNRRMTVVRAIFLIVWGIYLTRLFVMQVIQSDEFSARAADQYSLRRDLEPARGVIMVHERSGDDEEEEALFPIVRNIPKYLIYAVPAEVDEYEDASRILAPVLGKPVEVLVTALGKEGDPYEPLLHGASKETWQVVEGLGIKGIYGKVEYMREYTEGPTFSAVSGFVRGYGRDRQGQYGIEQEFHEALDGVWGILAEEFDAQGNPIPTGTQERKDAVPGDTIILTLDHNIQYQACERLAAAVERNRAQGGSIIIMDPVTGAVRAMCSMPRYDPNQYAEVDDLHAFDNQSVMRAYEPGSIFKAITMAAALDTGAVKPDTKFVDEGVVKIGKEEIRNADDKVYGEQTMTQVLAQSINTGVIYAQQATGKEAFVRIIKAFGFGQKTGITLPAEASGNISSLDKKGDIYAATASFGQGITATPLQMVTAFAAIANGGEFVRPYIVEEIARADGTRESYRSIPGNRVITPATATLLKAMLVTVVEEGHGKRAGVKGYWVAGKTGTAQVARADGRGYDARKTIGSFVGFGPVDHPRFVMITKIDEPETVAFAESTAAPLFGELADYLLNYYRVKPERE